MVYVALHSVLLKKNPLKRARFLLWASMRAVAVDKVVIYFETNIVHGNFVAVTVFETRTQMLDFQHSMQRRRGPPMLDFQYPRQRRRGSASELTAALRDKDYTTVLEDVAIDSTFYSYETDCVPSCKQAFDFLEAVKEGVIDANSKSTRERKLEQDLCKSWEKMQGVSSSPVWQY